MSQNAVCDDGASDEQTASWRVVRWCPLKLPQNDAALLMRANQVSTRRLLTALSRLESKPCRLLSCLRDMIDKLCVIGLSGQQRPSEYEPIPLRVVVPTPHQSSHCPGLKSCFLPPFDISFHNYEFRTLTIVSIDPRTPSEVRRRMVPTTQQRSLYNYLDRHLTK